MDLCVCREKRAEAVGDVYDGVRPVVSGGRERFQGVAFARYEIGYGRKVDEVDEVGGYGGCEGCEYCWKGAFGFGLWHCGGF